MEREAAVELIHNLRNNIAKSPLLDEEKEIIDLVQPITMSVGRLAGLALRARDKEASVVEIREELKLLLTRLGAHVLHLMEAKCTT